MTKPRLSQQENASADRAKPHSRSRKSRTVIVAVLLLSLGLLIAIGRACNAMRVADRTGSTATSARDRLLEQRLGCRTPAGVDDAVLAGPVRVVRVVDGDTIVIDTTRLRGPKNLRLRYIGIDTPELAGDRGPEQPHARAATDANAALVEDRWLWLEIDEDPWDRYDRLLAYAYVVPGWTPGDPAPTALDIAWQVNAALVEQGWAEARDYPPNSRYVDHFDELARAAMENAVGRWR